MKLQTLSFANTSQTFKRTFRHFQKGGYTSLKTYFEKCKETYSVHKCEADLTSQEIDEIHLKQYNYNAEKDLIPINVTADANCFYNLFSKLRVGNESMHTELR